MAPTVQVQTPAELLAVPESSWPVGSVAKLFAPTPVDRGIWAEPALVSQFVKRSNGKWLSYPGSDVSYPSLAALALAAPVEAVTTPAQPQAADPGSPEAQADAGAPNAGEVYYMATTYETPATAPAPGSMAEKIKKFAPFVIGAGILWYFLRRRR